jgi:hypothetical protein
VPRRHGSARHYKSARHYSVFRKRDYLARFDSTAKFDVGGRNKAVLPCLRECSRKHTRPEELVKATIFGTTVAATTGAVDVAIPMQSPLQHQPRCLPPCPSHHETAGQRSMQVDAMILKEDEDLHMATSGCAGWTQGSARHTNTDKCDAMPFLPCFLEDKGSKRIVEVVPEQAERKKNEQLYGREVLDRLSCK